MDPRVQALVTFVSVLPPSIGRRVKTQLVRSPRPRSMRRTVAAGLGISLMLATVAPVAAARPSIDRTINIGFYHEQHFDADPSCGPSSIGVTEIATGNDRLVIVDQGDHLHVTFGETFKILLVPDDPSLPTSTRQGTDALTFNLLKNGTEIFHESFHDYGLSAWMPFAKIRMVLTFVYANGEVQVDRALLHDFPPPGC